ncbi:MAG: AAA family ATPase [Acidobacteriota bacterium]
MKNPFNFAGELDANNLVDRKAELAKVERTIRDANKLFLIGPRRFGKTSILKAAQTRLNAKKAIVLRFDATAFPTLELLVSRIVSHAAGALHGDVKWVGEQLAGFFSRIRPDMKFSPADGEWSVGFGIAKEKRENPMFFVDALDGLENLAAQQPQHRPVGLILDEFQRVNELGGVDIEAQIRAAIQQHSRVGYVFAGSKTRMLQDMVSNHSRPFYRFGDVTYLGPIPREAFTTFLKEKFAEAGYEAGDAVVTRILDLAQDVPYNVQAIASHCWYRLMDEDEAGGSGLTPEFVDETLNLVVRQQDPTYAGIWSQLTPIQQRTLMYMVAHDGEGITSSVALREIGHGASTISKARSSMVNSEILREDQVGRETRYRFEDPFLCHWIRMTAILQR